MSVRGNKVCFVNYGACRSGMAKRSLCVQGSLDNDSVGQIGLFETYFFVVELSERKRRRQDERRAASLAACHKVLNISDARRETGL